MAEKTNDRYLEIFLVLIILSLGAVLYWMDHARVVVLYLFFLPVVLAGFYLGKYSAGVFAFLSVIISTIVIFGDIGNFSGQQTPIVVALTLMIWGAVLGLTAIFIGTLNEEKNSKVIEIHEAHLGVVEVLTQYLRCADPMLQQRTQCVNNLAEQVAMRMRLTPREVDDLRVASLLLDISNIEITARVIRKAVGDFDLNSAGENTFHGSELVKSLGSSLSGAFPMVLLQSVDWSDHDELDIPIGAKILKVVRQFVELTETGLASSRRTNEEAIQELVGEYDGRRDVTPIINVIEEIRTPRPSKKTQPVTV